MRHVLTPRFKKSEGASESEGNRRKLNHAYSHREALDIYSSREHCDQPKSHILDKFSAAMRGPRGADMSFRGKNFDRMVEVVRGLHLHACSLKIE